MCQESKKKKKKEAGRTSLQVTFTSSTEVLVWNLNAHYTRKIQCSASFHLNLCQRTFFTTPDKDTFSEL